MFCDVIDALIFVDNSKVDTSKNDCKYHQNDADHT